MISELFPDAEFSDPATDDDIRALEEFFGCLLPSDLESLLRESNGVYDHVFSSARMIEENQFIRANPLCVAMYMPLDAMICFGGDGTGSMFAYPICGGDCNENPRIIYWCHETDDRTLFVGSLEQFFRHRASE